MRRALVALAASLALAPLAAAQGWLDTARWYLQSPFDQFHAIGDVNADGFDDLVLFHGEQLASQNVHWTGFQVAFNDGTGQFPTLGPLVSFPVSPNFTRPLVIDGVRRMQDVTGDGLLDLILLEETPTFSQDVALHVYPGLGGGAFGAPSDIPVVKDMDAITMGQADGDPAFEIAFVDQISNSEHLRWWDWNGAAFVGSEEAFIFGGVASPTVARLVALDLDADGDDDLVFGQQFGQNLRSFTTVSGTPVLGPLYTTGAFSSYSLYPFVVDLLGGGAQDLLVAEVANGGQQFWFQPVLNQGGTLVPGAKQAFVGGSIFGNNLEPCDWDADGDTDMLAFGWQEGGGSAEALVAQFRNDGSDGFGADAVGKAELMSVVANTTVGASDLDGDGHLDAIGPQSIWFGRGRFEDSLSTITYFFYGPEPALARDAEGDGDLDVFFKTGGGQLNDGTGAFSGAFYLPAPPAGQVTQGCTAVGDFTGDGLVDFAEQIWNPQQGIMVPPTFAFMRLVKDDGLGHLVDGGTANALPMQPFSRSTSLVRDFDGDGDSDVWRNPNGYWVNDGAGHFPSFVPIAGNQTEACAAGDVNGDGDADLAAIDWVDRLLVLHTTAPGSWEPALVHDDPFGLDADSVTFADHDADGDLDLSCARGFADAILLFANDGTGSFSATDTLTSSYTVGADPPLAVHAFEDVDGDGLTDLLAGPKAINGNTFPSRVGLYRGTGAGYEGVRWYVGSAMGAAADADGDGDLDLVGRNLVRSRLFDGPADGIIRQYGAGTLGAGGAVPVLGGAGPLRPGSTTAALRLRRAAGGVPMLLLFSFVEGAIPNSPFQGSTLYVQPPFNTLLLVTTGSGGAAGQGALDLGLTPVLPIVAGITVYHQAALFEPGKKKVTSNGLQFTYGL